MFSIASIPCLLLMCQKSMRIKYSKFPLGEQRRIRKSKGGLLFTGGFDRVIYMNFEQWVDVTVVGDIEEGSIFLICLLISFVEFEDLFIKGIEKSIILSKNTSTFLPTEGSPLSPLNAGFTAHFLFKKIPHRNPLTLFSRNKSSSNVLAWLCLGDGQKWMYLCVRFLEENIRLYF